MNNLTRLGRLLFAAGMIASGIQQVGTYKFVRLVPPLPAWIPVHSAWACLVGVVLVVTGLAVAANKKVSLATAVLCALLLATFLFQRVPEILSNPGAGFMLSLIHI